jgi:hypothetical protein
MTDLRETPLSMFTHSIRTIYFLKHVIVPCFSQAYAHNQPQHVMQLSFICLLLNP